MTLREAVSEYLVSLGYPNKEKRALTKMIEALGHEEDNGSSSSAPLEWKKGRRSGWMQCPTCKKEAGPQRLKELGVV